MSNFKLTVVASIAILFSLVSLSVGEECATITLHYNVRPPYLIPSGNAVTGLTATPAAQAFEKVGIKFQWKEAASKRQLPILQENKDCDCAVGWFKNPEREKYALYTKPIYRDKPQVVLVRKDETRIKDGATFEEVLSTDLRFLVKDGYSYGVILDEKIAKFGKNIRKTTNENTTMIKMIAAKRADSFILAPEEAEGIVKAAGLKMTEFKLIHCSDMPEGNYRYILCSKKVGESVINKLNAVLP